MKKIFSLFAAMMAFVAINATVVDVDFSAKGYENGVAVSSVELDEVVSVSFENGSNSSNGPKYYNTGTAIRCYGGNKFTVSAKNANLTRIALTFGSGDGSNGITYNVGTYADGVWTGVAEEVVFTVSGSSGHRRVKAMSVTYVATEAPAVEKPVFDVAAGSYYDPQTVALSCSTVGASIYYTLDGSVPTSDSTRYTAPLTISETTTVKAIAIKGADASEVVTKTYEIATQYASLDELVNEAGEPVGQKVVVTLNNVVIDSLYYNKSNNCNGVYLTAGGRMVEIFCYDVPEGWAAGGTISGTVKGEWKKYYDIWEVCPANWEGITYQASAPVINYWLVGTAAENGWEATTAMPMDGDSIVRSLTAGTYEFKVLVAEGSWDGALDYSNVNADCSSEGYEQGSSNNVNVTLSADGDLKVKIVGGQICVVGSFCEAVVTSYTIAGETTLMGVYWDPTAEANDMTENEGVWTLVKTDLVLEAGYYEYKLVGNHDWGVADFPIGGNNTLTIDEAGTYNVTFTWIPAENSLTATAVNISGAPVVEYNFEITSAEIVSGKVGDINLPTNGYGSQVAATSSTWYTFAKDGVEFKGARVCVATDENGGGIQMQGNASDVSKQGFIFNNTEMPKIEAIKLTFRVVSTSTFDPGFHLYVGSAAHPTATAVDGTFVKTTEGGFNKYVYTFPVTGEPSYFTIANDLVGALYLDEIKVAYKPTATAIDNVESVKAVKVIENGQVVIIKNGVKYNVMGQKF